MQNLRGILFVTLSMAAFALEDAFIKSLTQSMPPAQALMLLGFGGALIFASMTYAQRGTLAPLVHPSMRTPIMLWRDGCEAISAVFFVSALALVPLSTTVAVFQATPLATTAGAALFMGEKVGWRRWSAIAIGFIGVLIIIRPGAEGFQPATLLPIASVIGIAARDLLTRELDPSIPSVSVAFYGFAALVVSGLILLPVNSALILPDLKGWLGLLGALFFGVGGYYLLVIAMRIAETSIIMPFRYSRLIFAVILGIIVFNERPDLWTYLGAALVIATGVYTFLRERAALSQR